MCLPIIFRGLWKKHSPYSLHQGYSETSQNSTPPSLFLTNFFPHENRVVINLQKLSIMSIHFTFKIFVKNATFYSGKAQTLCREVWKEM